jgi:hypothetical protein
VSSRCVSSNRRAFSRATLRLAAKVDNSRTVGLAEGILVVHVLERNNAGDAIAGDQRHKHGLTTPGRQK